MDSIRKLFPMMRPEDEPFIRAELLRMGAEQFELSEMWTDAAEMWAEAGDHDRAGQLYARSGNLRLAAQEMVAAAQYQTALELYTQWVTQLPQGDVVGRVQAWLGQAACHLLAGKGVEGLSAAAGETLFQQAYGQIVIEREQGSLLAARCWAALGAFGRVVGRPDLTHEGYEQALTHYEESGPEQEKITIARTYLEILRAWDDRLLAEGIELKLAGWGSIEERPEWEQQREEIERHPFQDGVRDVIHFTQQAQWAAWEKLAEMENEPAVDEYLRTLAPPQMVYIPAGRFLMGSGKDDPDAKDHEKPQHELWLRGYYIDRFPVTNGEYRQFMEAGGYDNSDHWTGAGWARKERDSWTQPRQWSNERFNGEKQPVVAVSWYEAVAYAKWAGKVLPSEAEWEKAAGWDAEKQEKRRYPWGNEWDESRGNFGGKHDRTTEVGQYAEDRSFYGMEDVAGNVDEWCSTRWQNEAREDYSYPYKSDDGREKLLGGDDVSRVIKGTRWSASSSNSKVWSRCGFRDWFYPWYRFDGV